MSRRKLDAIVSAAKLVRSWVDLIRSRNFARCSAKSVDTGFWSLVALIKLNGSLLVSAKWVQAWVKKAARCLAEKSVRVLSFSR